jgi:hypothetical protein
VLLRALVGLEDGGGTEFFDDPQLEIADLLRTAPDGRGIVSCVELPAVQVKADGAIGDFLNSSAGKSMEREVVRGAFGLLKKKL